MDIERKNQLGNWIPDELDRYIDRIIKRTVMKTREEVESLLMLGNEINYDNDWYAKIRMVKEEPKIDYKAMEASRKKQDEWERYLDHDGEI